MSNRVPRRYGIKQILDVYGYEATSKGALQFAEDFVIENVVPGVCGNCGLVLEYEPDQTEGWCDECHRNTVKSGLVILGLI
jgi:hypothetical protein